MDSDIRGKSEAFERRLIDRVGRIAKAQQAPAYLRDRILANLTPDQFKDRRRFAVRWDLLAAGFGGAVLSAAAALVIWLAAPPAGEPSTAWVDVALSHVTAGALMETDEPLSLRAWLESQVDHVIDVPNIPNAQLKGGRLAYVAGIRGAAVEYQIDGMDLTYIMVPEDVAMDAFGSRSDTMAMWESRGYQIVMWKQGGGTRALVAPMQRDRLFQLADHCRRTMI